jgi:hypothetical protein
MAGMLLSWLAGCVLRNRVIFSDVGIGSIPK